MSATRIGSLLAWLAGFDGRLEECMAHISVSQEEKEQEALCLLQDGQVLWDVMDHLYDGELRRGLIAGQDNDLEEEAGNARCVRSWKTLLPYLETALPTDTIARMTASHPASPSPSQPPLPLFLLPTVLEAFLGIAVGPQVPRREASIRRILSLPADDQERLKAVIEEQMASRGPKEQEIPDASSERGNLGEKGGDTETRVGRQEAGGMESGREEATTLPEGGRRMGHQGEEEGAGGGISKERSGQGMGKDEGSGGGRSGARAPSASCSTNATGSSFPVSVRPERGEGEGQPPVPGAASLSALHAQIATLERENRELREAEEAARGREEKGRRETEALQASLLSHSLAGDMAALRKEEEQQARAMEMGKRLVLAEKGCQEAEGLRAQVKELQDEVDVLRPAAESLALTEASLEKARGKLQGLQDVRDRLQAEQAAHGEALEKCLQLERELQQVPVLKRQVETLKAGATENELLLRELQATAAEQERTAKAQTEEIATLRQSLSMAALRSTEPATGGMLVVGEGQAGGGVGVGLTECNPDVVRNIRTLEAEVERLRAQISDTAVEKMEALEAEKDRHRRLAESFEERYRKTVADLTAQTHCLEVLQEGHATLQEQFKMTKTKAAAEGKYHRDQVHSLTASLAEAREETAMSQEELQQRVHHQGKVLRRAHALTEARAWLASLGMNAWLKRLREEKKRLEEGKRQAQATGEEAFARLTATEHCVALLKAEGEAAAAAAATALAEAQEAGEKRVTTLWAEAQAHIQELERQQAQALRDAEGKLRAYQEGHRVSNEEHYAQVEAERRAAQTARQEAVALGEAVEEAAMVQARMEKEKKFLREEAQSLRKELARRGSLSTATATASGTTGPGSGCSLGNNLSREELEAHYQDLHLEYTALLKDYRRQQAGIQMAEHSIGFSLEDFSPANVDVGWKEDGKKDGREGVRMGKSVALGRGEAEEEEEEERGRERRREGERCQRPGANPGGRGLRGGAEGGLAHDFEKALAPTTASSTLTPAGPGDGRGNPRRLAGKEAGRGRGGGQGSRASTVFTLPERVPVVVTEGLHHQISELLDKNRGFVVEQTAARATIHRLERELAAWKGKVTGKEEEIGSMRYQMARLERQVEKMTGPMGGSERRVLGARQENL